MTGKYPTLLGPIKCHQCKALVRWVRVDGTLLLVNDAGRRVHKCSAKTTQRERGDAA
jgi:hypothetical protein